MKVAAYREFSVSGPIPHTNLEQSPRHCERSAAVHDCVFAAMDRRTSFAMTNRGGAAHGKKKVHVDVQALFAGGKVCELWRQVASLYSMHDALWQRHQNRRKAVMRPIRYSVKAIYDSGADDRSGPHERIVWETRKLMEFIENATANSSIEQTLARRGCSGAAHLRR
jgi:hypothetical protein